ncbi:MAG: flagellar hook-basal body complex protein FliE [Aquificaceae bacterium]|nr:flagellar hook-basal body complex protein FliE [Aquificaceae bacterium]MCS7196054.1 flagellar hook-basal body complex protein FliE [Aquificaceae bacterium]MDW8032284.1 flagellar hook-basal body complex protein FliE [Aquificaceae bacterium]MDW8294444.1 flagellar hook-basal body complex protein FliE [Aquificaceae bacterium]
MEIKAIEGFLIEGEKARKPKGGDFLQELGKFLHWVNREQKKSEAIREAVLKGEEVPLHQMVVELEKASLALNLLLQVRNKLLEAFQELNRMQV